MTAMGDVLPYRPPKAREETTAYLGMVIFLASWAMLFAALFFAYGFVRSRSLIWPPADLPSLPKLLPLVNTIILSLSSGILQLGARAIGRGAARQLALSILGALLLGSLFLGLQIWLWVNLYGQGLRPDTGGPYGSVFYGLTWLHGIHVAVGLIGLAWVYRRAQIGAFSAARHLPVRLWAMYWHFVGAVWALMFVSIFLV
jgi:cytochrome c oxidase subunit 3